ncbi:MAG TPA: hypothetical protein PLF40_07785 [Kofleriaceae bacterium]|nr:hypothetical protein [Kofleriaceae bacterium]
MSLATACSHASSNAVGSRTATPAASAAWQKVPSLPFELQIPAAVTNVAEATPSNETETTFTTDRYSIVVRQVQRDALELKRDLAEAKAAEVATYQNLKVVTEQQAVDHETFLLEFDANAAFVSYGRYLVGAERLDCSGTATTADDRAAITAACKTLRAVAP